jgi:hypothetical protein
LADLLLAQIDFRFHGNLVKNLANICDVEIFLQVLDLTVENLRLVDDLRQITNRYVLCDVNYENCVEEYAAGIPKGYFLQLKF